MINPDTIIIRSNKVIARKISNEFIILDASRGSLYKLNSTAQAIWKSTRLKKSVKEIIKTISENFNISKKEIKEDVIQFVGKHLDILFYTVGK